MLPLQVFQKYCPEKAVRYCYDLWHQYGFHLRISRARNTKFGDYKFNHSSKTPHQISINENLNPYAFLITYLHEVAHLQTFKKYGNKVNPHGKEWKKNFQEVISPVLTPDVFPTEVLLPLKQYMYKPKASSCSDAVLFKALHLFDQSPIHTMLIELEEGERFKLNGRTFEKREVKRTRIICKEVPSGKRYLIAGQALVEKVQS